MTIPDAIAARAETFAGRGWVARAVDDWLANGPERVLVITGEPGSGKTALAAWLAGAGPVPADPVDAAALERIRAAWAATHFCVPLAGGTVSPVAFIGSLADRLAARLGPDFLPAVARANDVNISGVVTAEIVNAPVTGVSIAQLVISAQSRSDSAINVDALWQDVIRKPLQELDKVAPGPSAVILVDALDEADRVARPNILSLLEASTDLPAGIRFLVTGSRQLEVATSFPFARVVDLSSDDSKDEADADVRVFVRGALAPAPDVEDRIVAAAAGNFLYVHFLVQEVASGARSLDRLEGLPGGLSALYDGYLLRLVGTGRSGRLGTRWSRELQPLLGCISVATPSAPRDLLADWLDHRDGGAKVTRLLAQTRQMLEPDDGPDGPGRRLYHRSMSDFLAAREYPTNGSTTENKFHTPPEAQHARIAGHYLRNYRGPAWRSADSYGLRNVAQHLTAVVGATRLPGERRKRTADLYRTVLDADFQAAQKATLGQLHPSLRDLRLAVDVALDENEVVPLLRCIAGYRALARSGAIAAGVFDAVDQGDFATALRDAEHYGPPPRPRGRWARVLDAWIAWQAARAGRPDDAADAARGVVGQWLSSATEAEPLYWELCRALVVRAGRTLVGAGHDPAGLLDVFEADRDQLEAEVRAAAPPPLSDADAAAAEDRLRNHMGELQTTLRDDPYEAVEIPFADSESQAARASSLRDLLRTLSPRPEGRAGIDAFLVPTRSNPYARYRDIGLVAIGGAVVAVPDDTWADERLRSILLAGLDAEGVTFTFDLPTLVLAETRRRGRRAPELSAYVERARGCVAERDRWGTGTRALAAEALALAAEGDAGGAEIALVEASRHPPGFAGYASAACLALANRCIELGGAGLADEPVWGPNGGSALIDLAREQASRVLDQGFRAERLELVERYAAWRTGPIPDLDAIHAFLTVTPDPDARRAFKDFAAAHWTAARTSETAGWLKALVPMVLEDTTTLDAMLARVLGPVLPGLTDRDLAEAARVVAGGLTDGRPWELELTQTALVP